MLEKKPEQFIFENVLVFMWTVFSSAEPNKRYKQCVRSMVKNWNKIQQIGKL